MRNITPICLIAGLAACGRGTPPEPNPDIVSLPTTITLKVGESRTVSGVVVRFAEVKSDSRCPADVTCVWQGNAELMFVLGPAVGEGPDRVVMLNTGVDPREGAALGLQINLVNLSPGPVSTTPTRDYQAEVRIDRAPGRT